VASSTLAQVKTRHGEHALWSKTSVSLMSRMLAKLLLPYRVRGLIEGGGL